MHLWSHESLSSTVKNMFKTGKMTYFTYVTLRYYRMVAKGDDAARLPSMQEFWDMDEETRRQDPDLVQRHSRRFTRTCTRR